MKVYVDFKDLDAEDMPSNISNKYDLQVRSINCGSEYRNVELVSLSDYTKQVRKEVCEEVRTEFQKHLLNWYEDEENVNKELYLDADMLWEILDQIQGE